MRGQIHHMRIKIGGHNKVRDVKWVLISKQSYETMKIFFFSTLKFSLKNKSYIVCQWLGNEEILDNEYYG